MQFVLATAAVTYWWPVTVYIPDPETPGKFLEQKLKVLFEAADQDEAIEYAEIFPMLSGVKARAGHERGWLERRIKNWDDVIGPDKQPVPFTLENLRAALRQSWFREGVQDAYSDSLNGKPRLGN